MGGLFVKKGPSRSENAEAAGASHRSRAEQNRTADSAGCIVNRKKLNTRNAIQSVQKQNSHNPTVGTKQSTHNASR